MPSQPKKFPDPQPFTEGPRPLIPLIAVDSSQIAAIGYSDATTTLAVMFTRGQGSVYHYPNVTPDEYQAFIRAESLGEHFGRHIKARTFVKYRPDTVAA